MIDYSILGAFIAILFGTGAGGGHPVRYSIGFFSGIGMTILAVFKFSLLYAFLLLVGFLIVAGFAWGISLNARIMRAVRDGVSAEEEI